LDYNHPLMPGQPTDVICHTWREEKKISDECEIPVSSLEASSASREGVVYGCSGTWGGGTDKLVAFYE
jgi:hypothetical protein